MKKPNLLLLYFVPLGTVKFDNYVDGFTSAMDLLSKDYNITWLNLAKHGLDKPIQDLSRYDIVFVKSNWGARVDRYTRKFLATIKIPKCLLISGSLPPDADGLKYYDLLFYETTWYERYVSSHPNIVKAFGVNTDIMKPRPLEKDIDWLTVGQFKWYKRMHLLAHKSGVRVAIGEKPIFYKLWKQEVPIYLYLKCRGIQLNGFLPYQELAQVYNRAKNLFIPAQLNGGGERAVMEAKACGIKNIEVLKDNPKLTILNSEPVLSHIDYARSLNYGIMKMI